MESRPSPRPRLKRKMGRSAATTRSGQSPQRIDPDLKCCGILHGNAVVVRSPSHITALVQSGCFGKGILSRSIPTWRQAAVHSTGSKEREPAQEEQEQTADNYAALQSKRMKLEMKDEASIQPHSEANFTSLHFLPQTSSSDTFLSGSEMTSDSVTIAAHSLEQTSEAVVPSSLLETTFCAGENPDFDQHLTQQAKCLTEDFGDSTAVTEYLQLSSEEAFYLQHEEEVLEVRSSLVEKSYTSCELWNFFCECDGHFIGKYKAYRYYKKQGWVPKSGLKFGVDFLLYKHGPAYYHSSYGVLVRMIDQSTNSGLVGESGNGGLTWHDVISLCRVNESAGKDLLICYITKPSDMTEEELLLPSCVSKFLVQEVFANRWIPDRERR